MRNFHRVLETLDLNAMGNTLKIEGVEGLEIKRLLGEGSFGVVYKGKWHGKFVAVKQLRHDIFWSHPEEVENFRRECAILRTLKHSNIVQMYEAVFPDNNPPILITELLWCDLCAFYKDSKTSPKVSLDETIRIMLDVGEGLKFLHVRDDPIIHRDIKSHNILLDSKLRAKIADLGQAKEFPRTRTSRRVLSTPVPGTTVYMAPETYLSSPNRNLEYGAEIDIFSFGVVLLELIVGHLPTPNPIWMPFTKGKSWHKNLRDVNPHYSE